MVYAAERNLLHVVVDSVEDAICWKVVMGFDEGIECLGMSMWDVCVCVCVCVCMCVCVCVSV